MAKRRQFARALGWTLGAVAASPLLAVAMTPTVSRALLRRALPSLAGLLGFRLQAEDAWLQLFPRAAAHARDVVVSGADGRPLLRLESFSASVALWRALFSGGTDIHVHEVEVTRPAVSLSREGLTGLKLKPELLQRSERRATVFVDRVSVTGGTVSIAALGDAVVRELSVDMKDALLGQPLQLSFQAAVLEDDVNASGTLSVSLPAGVFGKVSLTDASLDALAPLLPGGVGEQSLSGTVNWNGELTTRPDGKYEATGDVSLESVRFRGLGPMQGQGHVRAVAASAKSLSAEVTGLELHGVRGELSGTLSASTAPLQSRVDLRSPRLDAGSFLAYFEPRAQTVRRKLAPVVKQRARTATVDLHLTVDELAFGRTTAHALELRGRVHDGVVTGERVTLTAFGGRVDASGSSLDLSQEVPSFELQARAASVDAAEATIALLGAPIAEGDMSGALQLRGRGTSYSAVRRTLTGSGTFGVDDWKLHLAEDRRVAPLRHLLGRKPLLRKERSLKGRFSVADGGVRVYQPIGFSVPLPERPSH